MYGKDIRKWLNSEKPEVYDFREEIVSFKGSDAIDRFFIYKALDIAKLPPDYLGSKEAQSYINNRTSGESAGYEGECEADNCSLVQAIYRYLWDKKCLAYCIKVNGLLTGETMNSCVTTIAEYLKPSINQFEMSLDWKKAHWGKQKLFCLYHDYEECVTRLLEPARKFLTVAYTIGNFIPVPVGCNGPRGFQNRDIEDYWDLTLWYIYQWYQSMDDDHLFKIVQTPENVKVYKKWLVSFGGWDRFVIANYMQDFVNEPEQEDEVGFGKPKELWTGHFTGDVLPKSQDQFEEFFSNAAEWIQARSKRMVFVLRTSEYLQQGKRWF